MQIKRKGLALAGLGTGLFVILFLGLCVLSRWVANESEKNLRAYFDAFNRSSLTEVADSIEQLEYRSLERSTRDWELLQSKLKKLNQSDYGQFAIVQIETSRVVVHPRISVDTTAADLPRFSNIEKDGQLVEITDVGSENYPGIVSGSCTVDNRKHFVSALRIESIGGILLVYQSEEFIATLGNQLQFPFWIIGLAAIFVTSILSLIPGILSIRQFDRELGVVKANIDNQVKVETEQKLRSRTELIFALSALAESRDEDAVPHQRRMRAFSRAIAGHLAKSKEEVTDEFIATLDVSVALHDIGKASLPDRVLADEDLSPAEKLWLMRHTEIGAQAVLEGISDAADPLRSMASDIALYHHAKWNGKGHPNEVSGKDIPIAARIVAVAELYENMTNQTMDARSPVSHMKAARTVVEEYGKAFDPDVVEAFVFAEDEIYQIARRFASRKQESIAAIENNRHMQSEQDETAKS